MNTKTEYPNRNGSRHIQRLLSQARSGSRAGMGRLAVITWERLYPIVFRQTWNHDVTEDILQETLLVVVQEVNSLRDTRRFWSWVYRIAKNKIRDNLRRSHLAASSKTLLRSQSDNDQASGDILDAKIREEKLQQLSALMEQLNRQHRDILRLRYYEQLPYTEIASMTHTTPEKLRSCFHRARKRLKAQLQDDTHQGVTAVL
jgi:RNA polymerase sigma-70 factor (ECF subfamily)